MAVLVTSPDDVSTGPPVTAPPALPGGRRLARAALEALLGTLVAVLISLAVQWAAGRVPARRPTFIPNDLLAFGASVLVAAALLLVARRHWPRWATPAAWVLLSATISLTLSLALLGTRYYLGGSSVDQSFRTEYLTRLASSPALADFTYRDVAPYYPGTWFWLGGRFADLAHLPAWAAFKPWAILTLAVTGVLAFALWSVLVRRRTAFALALLTAVVGLTYGADEPYSWLITATIPPLAVLAWRLVRALAAREPVRATGPVLVLGVALGVYGDLYTLYLVFFLLLLVVLGVLAVVLTRHRPDPGPGRVAGRILGRYVAAGVLGIVVMLPIWTPYLLAVLGGNRGSNVAAHFLPPQGANLPFPMLEFSVPGALCLLGTGWIVLNLRRSAVAAALGVLAATCYLWYLLSFVVLVAHTTLLAFRFDNVLVVTLCCAGLLGVLDVLRLVRRHWPARRETGLLAGALGFAVLVTLVQNTPYVVTPDAAAFEDYYPTGVTALGHADPADHDYWVPRLNATIAALTGRPPQDVVLLSDQSLLVSTSPYWNFQALTPHYADPLAQFDARRAEIESWAGAGSPGRLAAELAHSRFTPPSVFVLTRTKAGLTLRVTSDLFPGQPNVLYTTVTFPAALFDGPQFTTRQVGPFTVVLRR